MSRDDRFDFTLDEETEKRLYDLMTDMDTRKTNRFWIQDKRGYHAEYVKVIRCKDCKHNKNNKWVDCPNADFLGEHLIITAHWQKGKKNDTRNYRYR